MYNMHFTSAFSFFAHRRLLSFLLMVVKISSSTRFNPWDLGYSVCLYSYACIQPYSLRYGLRLSKIMCLNIIDYLFEKITWCKRKMRKILHAFYNGGIPSRLNIMYASFNIFFQGIGPAPCRWVRYAPESYLIWPSLYRHGSLGVRLAPMLGGWAQ
jgi:hypothetical protein